MRKKLRTRDWRYLEEGVGKGAPGHAPRHLSGQVELLLQAPAHPGAPHLPHLHPRSSNSLSQALPTRAAEVVGAVLVVAAMPPHPTTSSTTLPSTRVRLKATLTMAMSSSLRRDCLYAMKYWSFLGWNGVEWRETW